MSIVKAPFARAYLRACLCALAASAVWGFAPVRAADTPSWVDPKLLEAAKKEGTLVIYSSLNEEEGLPIWKAVRGRIPARADVETNPPGVLKALLTKKVMPITLDPDQEKKADSLFKELIAGRR